MSDSLFRRVDRIGKEPVTNGALVALGAWMFVCGVVCGALWL